MRHNLIKTPNYLLVVDDSEIKVGDWFYNNVLKECTKAVWEDKVKYLNSNLETFKVISHSPLNGAPVLEDVPVLASLPQEDEAEEIFPVGKHGVMHMPNREQANNSLRQEGYNKAREKYKDDLMEILMDFDLEIKKQLYKYPEIDHGLHAKMCDDINDVRGRFIQSLQQPKYPVAFECEMVEYTPKELLQEFLKTNQ